MKMFILTKLRECKMHQQYSCTLYTCHTLTSLKFREQEGCGKSKWKFKMAFAIRRPAPPPLMAQIFRHFFTPLFSFAIESYIYETDFTLQKYHF